MTDITFLSFGTPVDPGFGSIVCLPWVKDGEGAAARLYRARCAGLRAVNTRYFCWLDGEPDVLLPGFRGCMERFAAELDSTGACIAYGDEMRGDERIVSEPYTTEGFRKRIAMIHHGVLCRTESARALALDDGCFSFEVLVYGALAERGFVYLADECLYQWNPSPNGARLWKDYSRAIVNSLLWHQGRKGVHFKADFA